MSPTISGARRRPSARRIARPGNPCASQYIRHATTSAEVSDIAEHPGRLESTSHAETARSAEVIDVTPRPCFASARDGDPHATHDVVEALRPRVARMSAFYARRTGEDADDLLQEAWLGVLEALPGLDLDIGQPDQYLLQRARWRVLDAIKRARVRRCLPLDDSYAEALPAREGHPGSSACVSEFTGSLKAVQRAVLGCLMDGLTWREAGSVLGCTSANVAYHVRQIRRRYEEWDDC